MSTSPVPETVVKKVHALIANFSAHEDFYLSGKYQEAEVRRDFIDPLFVALGWDVLHDRQKNPLEQEVKIEKSQTQHGAVAQKRADYAFFQQPNFRDVLFFVEAKKPWTGFEKDADAHFQTHRYGWNAGTPIAFLTDFHSFHVIDCREDPDINTALNQIVRTRDKFEYRFHYRDFLDVEKLARLYWLCSREAVVSGAFNRFELALLKGGAAKSRVAIQSKFGDGFLAELELHRAALASGFKAKNPSLDGETLTELTQRTLDRMIFLRFLEDKLIETRYQIANFLKPASGAAAWRDFQKAARVLDATYNGIVFKEHPLLDGEDFAIEEKSLQDALKWLSHTHSKYDFNTIPIHILGSIYERFLGNVIVTTAIEAHPEQKPEIREQNGVYYTPEYIVHYIVENTVGRLVANKSPKEIAKMRFADIACGSGSFLIGVFDYLLRHHVAWYNANPNEAAKAGCMPTDTGAWKLSLQQRRQILTSNIFGVDIDAQAVEVAQLSLYLKLLEDETTASARGYQTEFHETLLPSLSKNIICGNSLIERDILDEQLAFAADEERKMNPMNFKDAFPGIFGDRLKEQFRRFDAIVGNPPFVLLQVLNQPYVFDYIGRKYVAARYKIDTYHVFLERALQLTKQQGKVGYITPNTFLLNKHAVDLRTHILRNADVEVLRLFDYNVFKASVDTAILTMERRAKPTKNNLVKIVRSSDPSTSIESTIDQARWDKKPDFNFVLPGSEGSDELLAKINRRSVLLGKSFSAYFGIQTKDRQKYVRSVQFPGSKPVVDGEQVNRYYLDDLREYVDFRPEAIKSGGKAVVYEQDRVGVRQIGRTPVATLIPAGVYTLNTIYNIFPVAPSGIDLKFVLGVVCSDLLGWYWEMKFFDQKKTFPKIKKKALHSIPLPKLDVTKSADQKIHKQVVDAVNQLLKATRLRANAGTEAEHNYLDGKITSLNGEIDSVLTKWYGLTSDEVAIIEEAAAKRKPAKQ